MEDTAERAIAIVAVGAVLPDAPSAPAFWENVKSGRDSISEVPHQRWDPALFYDPNRSAPDKTYSKIGGWVKDRVFDPIKWRLPIPPRVAAAMDETQKWAVACAREALEDYGYPKRPLDAERTAVILGNAMAGEMQFLTVLRAYFPEYAQELEHTAGFGSLPEPLRGEIVRQLHARIEKRYPEITEDSMPGELSNCIAGRIANLFNFRGPNFTADAACASAMAAMTAAVTGLLARDFDAVLSGGVDHNMGASTFIKFCKIGALSATGSRPYAQGADGFVMGEGAALFLMKRLADAERDGDRIYAVLRGLGGASDGKGKGITAPNPVGQKLAVERAWKNAGLSPATATLIEGHGTSTPVGDIAEMESMNAVLGSLNLARHSIALGSAKSNIGHLKAAAGAAGILKAAFALRDKMLPPSLHCERPNPEIDFEHSPFLVNTELRPWPEPKESPRRAGVSAFGFGGANFHVVLEEHIPGRLTGNGKRSFAVPAMPPSMEGPMIAVAESPRPSHSDRVPLRGALLLGASSEAALAERLRAVQQDAARGHAPAPSLPAAADLRAPERIAIDYGSAAELADKGARALQAIESRNEGAWKALRARGIFRGRGSAPKVAFLYTGQGSQYVNMLLPLVEAEPLVQSTFAEADAALKPFLAKKLTEYIFVDHDEAARARAEEDLKQTAITQPAVLAADIALTRLLGAYGVDPDMAMGHSLGEYGALVAAGALPFGEALEAVSARGREMTRVSVADNGRMAAVFAPLADIERVLTQATGYVVIANLNSEHQAVIGGASEAVEQAVAIFQKSGYHVAMLPVSHAFHTSIVAPASGPLRQVLERLHLQAPRIPVIANLTGEFYPTGEGAVPKMLDILERQVASAVQFVKGIRTLYAAGARVFVETGPKRALHGFVEDVLQENALALFTNHPKNDVAAFNQALCGLYASGLGRARHEDLREVAAAAIVERATPPAASVEPPPGTGDYTELGKLFASVLDRGWRMCHGAAAPAGAPVVITGAALGLPGTERVFDDTNVARILRGEGFIGAIPERIRQAMVEKNVTRLVKSEQGGPTFETIHDVADVIKLAGRGGACDLEREYGLSADRLAALDRVTQLAIASGIDALRDAGIPLVMRYKTTTKGTQLPDRWMLPECMRDDTAVVFASAFPGYDAFAQELSNYFEDKNRRDHLATLVALGERVAAENTASGLGREIAQRVEKLRSEIASKPFLFDRRFLFRILSMGHSQFAEYIGARGPNTQLNAACASTTQAIALANDWLRAGRCRRAVVISADDVTSDNLMEWIGSGFLATGAAATDERVEDAAIPFDRRRHGMLIGMGAAALVLETAEAARERGIQPICELLGATLANSAYHGTRLDVQHICDVMEQLVSRAEAESGIRRAEIAAHTVFVSHETYTPARGGSASAEVNALRRVFGQVADQIVIANTKGFTGHPMGTGIEDVLAVKTLETGIVPPVANFKEVDPELGALNLSRGGHYPVDYALRLAAGFGSQVAMTLLRWTPVQSGIRPAPDALGYAYRIADRNAWEAWLKRISGTEGADLEIVNRTLRVCDARSARLPAMAKAAAAAAAASIPIAPPPIAVAPLPPAPKKEAAAVPPPAPVAPPPVPATGDASVKDRVLMIVAEKTGYPPDMLDLDLDLEADLGVDTVKQAEVFAAVRAAYGISRDETLRLRDFPTLAHVIRFVHDRRPDLRSPAPGTAPSAPATGPVEIARATAPAAGPDAGTMPSDVRGKVLALVVEKTGYPQDMLDLDLDLEADLGIDTVKQAELLAAIRETYGIPRDESLKLRDYPTLAHVIRFVLEKRPDLAAPAPAAQPPVATVAKDATALAAAAPQPPAMAPATTPDGITNTVLDIVAEKTGYPKDMLDLDLDLEADLGVDTVKQAEMFAAVRAAYNIPRDETMKLRDFPTLAHVIGFARERIAKAAAPAVAPVAPLPAVADATAAGAETASFEAANRVPRRVPVPVLRPGLDLCKATAVQFAPGRRVVLMPDRGGVAEALTKALQALGVEVLHLDPAADEPALTERLNGWIAAGPLHGVYWLPALDDEGDLGTMNAERWHEALRVRIKLLYTAMRVLYEQISAPGTFLLTGTRLGGQHGYDAAGATAPLGGAAVGFTKAYRRERMDVLAKAVDFEIASTAGEVAALLLAETLRDPGAAEIGYKNGLRWTVALHEEPASDGHPGMTLDCNSVFVVTGAAGSIVSAITADLARASGGTFYLLDVVPEPDEADSDLARFSSDKEGLKRDLFARIQAEGKRATPALVEKQLAALERAKAALDAIDAVRAAGGTAQYFSVNLLDAKAVAKVGRDIRRRSGHVDVLLHAAGMERSHFLPDKPPAEFDLIFDVKADGWFHLLHALGDMPLGATVAFSSIAGRFGNGGQADYSAANDLLCKIASSFRRTRPATRAIAIDWTAWAGIGMASRGSIPKMMEVAGIDMLPPEAGIPWIRRELTSGAFRGEVLVAQRLGALQQEWDPDGGVDKEALETSVGGRKQGPMTGSVRVSLHGGVTVDVALDPAAQPFLHDHQIDGTPVLPGVMGIEAFAEAAACLLPEWHVEAVENVNFLAPFKFYRGEKRTVSVHALIHPSGEGLVAECVLCGSRMLPGQAEPQVTTNFTGRVRLARTPAPPANGPVPAAPAGSIIEAEEIYRLYFHGPAYRVLEAAWSDGSRLVGWMARDLPANHHPPDLPLRVAPRLVELCEQTAGLWELGTQARMGLPQHIDALRLLRAPELSASRLHAVVTPDPAKGTFDAEVVDESGNRYLHMTGYRTVALPGGMNPASLKALQAVLREECEVEPV